MNLHIADSIFKVFGLSVVSEPHRYYQSYLFWTKLGMDLLLLFKFV